MSLPPDPSLSQAGRDLIHRVKVLAAAHPDASAVSLVWTLAAEYIPGRLKKQGWWRR